jgi:hypothetical protein
MGNELVWFFGDDSPESEFMSIRLFAIRSLRGSDGCDIGGMFFLIWSHCSAFDGNFLLGCDIFDVVSSVIHRFLEKEK